MNSQMHTFDRIASYGVVPVIAIDNSENALDLADALIAGGLPIAEITLRTPDALPAIELIARHRPEMIIGAGTVLDEQQSQAAKNAGAMFALAPGIDKDALAHAERIGLPFAPGIMTPSDLQLALRQNCKMVKFFPAQAAGGLALLKSMAGPYLHTGIGFNPTGGVTLDNMSEWLAYEPVRAVGGTWIASSADIEAGHWDRITENAVHAVEKARVARSG